MHMNTNIILVTKECVYSVILIKESHDFPSSVLSSSLLMV